MNWKLFLFFIAILFTLLYFVIFWENRKAGVEFKFFNMKIDTNLGLLLLAVFFDGIILTLILAWLLGFLHQ